MDVSGRDRRGLGSGGVRGLGWCLVRRGLGRLGGG